MVGPAVRGDAAPGLTVANRDRLGLWPVRVGPGRVSLFASAVELAPVRLPTLHTTLRPFWPHGWTGPGSTGPGCGAGAGSWFVVGATPVRSSRTDLLGGRGAGAVAQRRLDRPRACRWVAS
jgi:hypothetical protein